MRKQITKIAAVLILAIGLTTSAAAQSQTNNDPPIQIVTFTGIESARAIEPITGKFYGNSYVLNSFTESETHHFTVSLDYSCEQCDMNSQFPVTVVRGRWLSSAITFTQERFMEKLRAERLM